MRWGVLIGSILLLGCGCTMGPDYRRPDIGITLPESFMEDKSAESESEKSIICEDKWWEAFQDPQLNHMVEEVLQKNWDLRKAASRVLEFQSHVVRTRSDRFPTLDSKGEAGYEDLYVEQESPGPVSIGPQGEVTSGPSSIVYKNTTDERFDAALTVGYDIDFWGKLSRADEAARSDLLRVKENRLAVIQRVVTETVSGYLEMESVERRIQLCRNTISSYKRSLLFVEKRYKRGLSDALAVRQARRALADAQTQMPALIQELGLIQHELSIMIGRYPETSAPRMQPGAYFQNTAPVPAGLPSELLRRRPDVRAAEAALCAANARIGEARADRFPSISLTGSWGYASTALDDLFLNRSRYLNGGLDVLAPLFDAGKRKAVEAAARARYSQAVADYAQTVLGAFADVEGALLKRKRLFEKRQRIINLVTEAKATLQTAQSRYRTGVSSYLNVLEAQRSRFEAEERLVLVDIALLTNRVGLHRALGGGWPNVPRHSSVRAAE